MWYCKRSEAIMKTLKLKKASITACFFCFALLSIAQPVLFTSNAKRAYNLTLNLQWEDARTLINPTDPSSAYVLGLSQAIELLVNEDVSKFEAYETAFETQIKNLQSSKKLSPEQLFYETELSLYWSFVHLKFGNEFDAAFLLRKSYQLAAQGKKKYPAFVPLLKSHGLLQIILGSVPEKYAWILGIMNMEGSIRSGLEELETVTGSNTEVSLEATLLLALVQGYVLQESVEANATIAKVLERDSTQRSALFIGASLNLKNSQAENALTMLAALQESSLPSVHYFLGEALLCKGEYEKSAQAFLKYTQLFKGSSFIKDAYFKTGLCYYLLNQKTKAANYFLLAQQKGSDKTEADKYAARTLLSTDSINAKLFKVRFFTDGGYYEKAKEIIHTITPEDLPGKKAQTEFYYRQARIAHKTNQLNAARLFYEQTIDMSAGNSWYFAPNACLQIGYIYQQQNNIPLARKNFEKALSYKKHEYKNSIDAKAKSALAQTKDRR